MSLTSLPPPVQTTVRATVPVLTALLGITGAAGGLYSFKAPLEFARLFGITVPQLKGDSEPSRRQIAYIQVHGIRNAASGAGLLGLTLYLRFSSLCQSSPLAAQAVRRSLGIVLAVGTFVGFIDGWILNQYARSNASGLSEDAKQLGTEKSQGHTMTAFVIAAIAAGWLVM